jgi:hypothetical protein
VEEIAAIYAVLKIMEWVGTVKEEDPIIDLIINKEVLNKLKQLYDTRKHLMVPIETLIHKAIQAPCYFKLLTEDLNFEVNCIVKPVVG